MKHRRHRHQRGQAIVLVAFSLVVLFGFVGLAVDSGHAYLERRESQAAVDAAALAAAYKYMNSLDYAQSQQAAMTVYAKNERVYTTPSCAGYGTTSATCSFGDPSSHSLVVAVASHSIAGVTFTASESHRIRVAMMQVLGAGPTVLVSATATAVARRSGTNGAAIQTLSPAGCTGGVGANSLSFTGTSTTIVTGDVWSNGSITDNGQASGSVNGNVIDICPTMPPSPVPNFTVSGAQANGWSMPDPGFAQPTLNASPVSWNSANGSVQQPGTYAANPNLTSANCYFLAGGVYNLQGGLKLNGGLISNELRPPDEPSMVAANQPNMTTTTSALTGLINSISVNALAGAVPEGSLVSVGGQTFTVDRPGAAAGDRSIPVPNQSPVAGTIASGSWLTVRALPQFWDSNGLSCGTTLTVASTGSGSDPPVNAQTWAVEVTAVRWSPNGVPSCTGPASPSCFLRESAPSMCKSLTVVSSQVLKVSVSSSPPDLGAQFFNVYLAPSGSCQGPFGYAAQFANSGSYGMTINGSTLPAGWAPTASAALDTSGAPPPDLQGPPVSSGLPNANPAAGTPPHGDLANEAHCADPATGNNVACPGAVTPGAVVFFIPGPGTNTVCLNLQGGGDIYVFSGFQFQRLLVHEPGPEQQPPANTCPNNVAGHGLTSLIGIYYAPAADVAITGNSQYLATIAGGVISYTATIRGNGGVSISVDPSLRTWPSAVRLTQ